MNPVLAGGLAALSIGCGDFIARKTTERVGVAGAMFAVTLVGTLGVGAWMLFSGTGIANEPWAISLSVASGVGNLIGVGCLFWAINRGPIAVASPIVSAHPALVVLISVPLGVHPEPLQWLGMAITFAGVLGLALAVRQPGGAMDWSHTKVTAIIAAVATVTVALRLVAAQEAVGALGPVAVTWITRAVATALVGVWILWLAARRGLGRAPSLGVVLLLIVHGALDTAGVLFVMLGSVGSGRAVTAIVFSCFTVVTVLLARVFLKEPVRASQWAAIAVVVAGVGVLAAA